MRAQRANQPSVRQMQRTFGARRGAVRHIHRATASMTPVTASRSAHIGSALVANGSIPYPSMIARYLSACPTATVGTQSTSIGRMPRPRHRHPANASRNTPSANRIDAPSVSAGSGQRNSGAALRITSERPKIATNAMVNRSKPRWASPSSQRTPIVALTPTLSCKASNRVAPSAPQANRLASCNVR